MIAFELVVSGKGSTVCFGMPSGRLPALLDKDFQRLLSEGYANAWSSDQGEGCPVTDTGLVSPGWLPLRETDGSPARDLGPDWRCWVSLAI